MSFLWLHHAENRMCRFYRIVSTKPWLVMVMPFWLVQGKAAFKERLAGLWDGSVEHWPYNLAVVEELEKAGKDGQSICLATAANEKIARRVAEHFGVFDKVVASTAQHNLKGGQKRDVLCAEYGEKGFDYVGDSAADLPVWQAARQAVVVSDRESGLVRKVRQVNSDCRLLPAGHGGADAYLKQIRVHQWVKNALIAIPMVFTRSFEWHHIVMVFFGMLCFSFLSSLIYVINDLADLQSDRQHLHKKLRPFASGAIPLRSGPLLAGLLLAAVVGLASVLPRGFWPVLPIYFFLNLLYSGFIKRMLMLDVVVLMMFYVMRIMAGDILLELPHSNWMIGFACFVFLGLSLIKRVAELILHGRMGSRKAQGRAYLNNEDRSILMIMAAASGFCSLTILAMYIDSIQATRVFHQPKVLWLLCPLIGYWYGRILILTNPGKMSSDPVRFVLTDPVSLATMGVGVVFVLCAAL